MASTGQPPGLDPEAYLESLEPIGWKLGLERMHRLCTLLGMPQHRFGSIHVVGTNGKSSVAGMVAALLEAHGVAAGACVSPHPSRWSERVLIRGEEIGPEEFAAAVARTAEAAETVDRALDEGEAVTQFEVATAAAFVAFAAARLDAAAIEAGLGGRLDATNTIPSRVTVLTSIGLDHTEWLGETALEIAAEKLAVLRDASVLVVGRLSPEVMDLAERTAAERGAALIRAPEDPGEEVRLGAPGAFQRRNFAVALAAAEAYLGGTLDPTRVAEVAAGVRVPGRLERLAGGEGEPPVYVDVAHNPDGARALAESLTEIAPPPGSGRSSHRIARSNTTSMRVVGCLAILSDKDASAMVRALAPVLERVVCTELGPAVLQGRALPGSSWRPAAELARLCEEAGVPAEPEPEFGAALARARELAAERSTALVVTGSHYVLGPARAALS